MCLAVWCKLRAGSHSEVRGTAWRVHVAADIAIDQCVVFFCFFYVGRARGQVIFALLVSSSGSWPVCEGGSEPGVSYSGPP